VLEVGWPECDLLPQIDTALAAHVLYGVALIRRSRPIYGQRVVQLDSSKPARHTRSIVSRAMTSLCERNLLAYRGMHPPDMPAGAYQPAETGYLLTPDAVATATAHEVEVPKLRLRWCLLTNYEWHRDGGRWRVAWEDVPEMLSSPSLVRADVSEPHIAAAAGLPSVATSAAASPAPAPRGVPSLLQRFRKPADAA
jgi:hypothetical protein